MKKLIMSVLLLSMVLPSVATNWEYVREDNLGKWWINTDSVKVNHYNKTITQDALVHTYWGKKGSIVFNIDCANDRVKLTVNNGRDTVKDERVRHILCDVYF